MAPSLRKTGVALGAALLMSAASASAAFASNPITISYASGVITINDPTGVAQTTYVATAGSGFDVTEYHSGNVLQEGTGITAAIAYSDTHWVVVPTDGGSVTKIVVHGQGGNDILDSTGVTNKPVGLYGDADNDAVSAGSGNDTVVGGAGNDYLYGGSGADVLSGLNGTDHVYGEDGDDTFFENDGYADVINGGNGTDDLTADALDTYTSVESVH